MECRSNRFSLAEERVSRVPHVRDRLPEIVERNGETPIAHAAGDDEPARTGPAGSIDPVDI